MAKPNYTKEEIIAMKPEEGELALLNILEGLDDSFEIFFQPNLNFDRPDIILLRKEYGVLVIEIKNFNYENSFIYNQRYNKSPSEQVEGYKDHLYELHINGLAEKKARDKKYYGIVKCALYLHGYTEEQAKSKLLKYDENYIKKEKYFNIIGKDSGIDKIQKVLSHKSLLFTSDLYADFKYVLRPSITEKEQLHKPIYSSIQNELINKLEPKQQKIKGPAGSGKTLILAQRAVKSQRRTGGNVLVLTYNITLRNYILDRISAVKESLSRKNFAILNYHNFFNIEANNYSLKPCLDDYQNENFFEPAKNEIKKYNAIFIDEIQDYETIWIRIIKKYFLEKTGEFIIFGDGKQKIYERSDTDMESDESPNTTIGGKWNSQLVRNYRMFGKIGELAKKFQQYFFKAKADTQLVLGFQEKPLKDHIIFVKHDYNEGVKSEKIVYLIQKFCKDNNIQEKEICVISSKISTVREVDYYYRKNNKGKKSQTTFEEQETFIYLHGNKVELEGIRRSKKYNFYMNPGCIKFSTIHSFKGWEAPYIFLILDKKEESNNLIYTAITRARYGLYVINTGNKEYKKFFTEFYK